MQNEKENAIREIEALKFAVQVENAKKLQASIEELNARLQGIAENQNITELKDLIQEIIILLKEKAQEAQQNMLMQEDVKEVEMIEEFEVTPLKDVNGSTYKILIRKTTKEREE